MDWIKVLQHGLSALLYVLLASVLAVLIGALTLALGYKPDGLIDPVIWQYVIYPGLVAIIAALDNWRKHLPTK
jgi:hypothetical protein